MSAKLVICHHCNKQEQYKRSFAKLAKSKGRKERTKEYSEGKTGYVDGAGQMWCSHNNTTAYADSEYYAQGAPRPEQELNFDNGFDVSFLFTNTFAARTMLPNGQETSIPVDRRTRASADLKTIQDSNRNHHHRCNRYRHDRAVSMGITGAQEYIQH